MRKTAEKFSSDHGKKPRAEMDFHHIARTDARSAKVAFGQGGAAGVNVRPGAAMRFQESFVLRRQFFLRCLGPTGLNMVVSICGCGRGN